MIMIFFVRVPNLSEILKPQENCSDNLYKYLGKYGLVLYIP